MKHIRLVALPLILLMVACMGDDDGRTTIDGSDAGTSIEIKADTTLRIRLDGNPTTGYEWEVIAVDESILRYIDSDFEPESDATGAGGIITLEFEALAPGATLLELIYKPAWETPSDTHLRYSVTVQVT